MSFLDQLLHNSNRTRTENGAVTLRTAGSDCLDLFATIGALRNQKDEEIIRRFDRAWAEDRDIAMKMLFYARDVRGGLGERRVGRVLLAHVARIYPESVRRNLHLIAEYGRWDDLLVLLNTPCEADALALMARQLEQDEAALQKGEPVSLLAKWLPSANTSSRETVAMARRILSGLHMTEARYRRMLSRLRAAIRIIENPLRERDYSFDYAAQPSGAMFKYRRAFLRNDAYRYRAFMTRVEKGEATLHAATLTPCDIVRQARNFRGSEDERRSLDMTWNALPDYTQGENALAVVDGSGSMTWGRGSMLPIDVALSLGLYFAEHTTGAFHNTFITFSQNPRLIQVKGEDLVDRVRYCQSFNEVANTNLRRVFELILATAVQHHVPQKELPSTLYIISDMEFDSCARGADLTNFEYARSLYRQHGYRLPNIVFWNVDSRNEQQPVRMNDRGVALVSGSSPVTFSQVISGETDPMTYMMNTLMGERYAPIAA